LIIKFLNNKLLLLPGLKARLSNEGGFIVLFAGLQDFNFLICLPDSLLSLTSPFCLPVALFQLCRN
jgi:hypothetical protein